MPLRHGRGEGALGPLGRDMVHIAVLVEARDRRARRGSAGGRGPVGEAGLPGLGLRRPRLRRPRGGRPPGLQG
eukprot:10379806-Lingulodinium_polyedra.AAC.1